MKKPLFIKIFGGHVVIILILAVFIILLSFATIKKHYVDTLARDLEHLGIALTPRIIPYLVANQAPGLDSLVKDLGNRTKIRITVIDPEGLVLADSEKDPKLMENHKARDEIIEALAGRTGKTTRFSRTVQAEMLYIALPIANQGRIIGVLRVSLWLSEIDLLLNNLKIRIFQIGLLMTFIALVFAFIFSRNLSKPISKLVNAARRVASGDFEINVILKDRDELKELAESFNNMVRETKNLVDELSQEKETLNKIILSIQEGIMVLDKKGKIILSNNSFKRIVETSNVEGRFYWELIRSPGISDLIKSIDKEKIIASDKIEINDRSYMCTITLLEAAEENVITLHDITDIMQVDRMKKDFVLNVSHELRTPLTAIKGFVETLEEEGSVKSTHYLEIIKRHTDRLIHIVQDLQLLAELDEQVRLELDPVNLHKILEPILRIFEPRLKEKGLDLNFQVQDGLPSIKGDRFKLEQMLINLIDNAVKYTEKGGVTISLKYSRSEVIIEVADTGIGIPEEHLSRIFERFYVVDKSRSRKMGGTGLGLSIVKHIVQAHRGSILIKSKPLKGTVFTIHLPR